MDVFGPIVYNDARPKTVARIEILWESGDVSVEEYRSPTEARIRWQNLKALHSAGLTIHVHKLRFTDLTGVGAR